MRAISLLGIGVFAAYPWITNAVLLSFLEAKGLTVEESRTGYTGTEWTGLKWSGGHTEVEMDRVDIPSLWALSGLKGSEGNRLLLKGMRIVLHPTPGDKSNPSSLGFSRLLMEMDEVWAPTVRYLPDFTISGIKVHTAAEQLAEIDELDWTSGRLQFRDVRWIGARTLPKNISLTEVPALRFERWGKGKFRLGVELGGDSVLSAVVETVLPEQTSMRLTWRWPDGLLVGEASWDEKGWIPQEATIRGQGTGLPIEEPETFRVIAPNFHFLSSYNRLEGSFFVDLDGRGAFSSFKLGTQMVPWQVSVRIEGDSQSIQVAELAIDLPGLKASLDDDLLIDRSTFIPSKAACLDWEINLGESFITGWEGEAEGTFCLAPIKETGRARFTVQGDALNVVPSRALIPFIIEKTEFSMEGDVGEKSLAVESFKLKATEMGEVRGKLHWDLDSGMLTEGSVEGLFEPELLTLWVTEESVKLPEKGGEFSLQGGQDEDGWNHSGRVSVDGLCIHNDWIADVQLAWNGRNTSLEDVTLALSHSDVSLNGQGSLEWSADGLDFRLSELREERLDGEGWSLSAPTRLRLSKPAGQAVSEWILDPLKLSRSSGGLIALQGYWSDWHELHVKGEVEGLALEDTQAWSGLAGLSNLSVNHLSFDLQTLASSGGQYSWLGKGEINASWNSSSELHSDWTGAWNISEHRLDFDSIKVRVNGEDWLRVNGILPISLMGNTQELLKLTIHADEPLELQAQMEPLDQIPALVAERLPFVVEGLHANLWTKGTPSQPEALLKAGCQRLKGIKILGEKASLLENLSLETVIGAHALEIRDFGFRLPDTERIQSIHGKINEIDWLKWIDDPGKDRWLELAANLEVDRFPLAALNVLFPSYGLPSGMASLVLEKTPGKWPTGKVTFNGLTWRSIGSGFVVRDISGSAVIDADRLINMDLTGANDGRTLRLEGWVDCDNWRNPRYHLQLETDQLDIIRQTDLIIRGRTSLEAVYEKSDTSPLLKGEIELGRSLWLKDLQGFTRKGVTSVAQRPPFFSIKTRPFSDWRLDVRVGGETFLNLRSTVFVGTASMDMHLGGTLGEPTMLGTVSVNNGAIRFPFATLRSSDIRAWIAEDMPHAIKLSGSGEGAVYGYSIQFQLAGTSEYPSLVFNSVPSLAQDELLLMLATGAVPSAEKYANVNERTQRLGIYLGQDLFSNILGQDGASRIEVRSGEGFSPFRREGQIIEYRMSDEWSILGEYDDFGGYNVDLRRILIER